MRPHRSWGFVLAFLGLNLSAAGPPPEGATIETQLGVGRLGFQEGGCDGPYRRYQATALVAHVQATGRGEAGLTGVAEVTAAPAVITSAKNDADYAGDASYHVGDLRGSFAMAARVGYHHPRYFGGELGVALLDYGDDPLPSAQVWAGVPRYVYAYGSLVTGVQDRTLVGALDAGFGHRGELTQWELGLGPFGARARFGAPFRGPVTLVAEGGVGFERVAGVTPKRLTLGASFDVDGR